MNLIPVKDRAKLDAAGIPFATKTLYQWHHMGLYKEMFVKMNRRLFVDADTFTAIAKTMRGK